MRQIATYLILLTLIVLVVPLTAQDKSPEQLFAEAKRFQEELKYPEAIVIYEQLVAKFPDSKQAPQSQFMIGFTYANQIKDLKKAEAGYKRFLELYSATAEEGLVASAQWELENLGRDVREISDSLIAPADTIESLPAPPELEKAK